MSSDEPWKFVSKYSEKLQGHVWCVERKGSDGREKGYFKFQNKENIRYGGPMIADEMIAAKLAKKAHVPVHDIEFTTIEGREGIVSIVKDVPVLLGWDELPGKYTQNIPKYFNHPKHLIGMFVLDVWTCNTDRGTDKNIIVYKNKSVEPYEIYLIDHNHTLHDANLKWKKHSYRSAFWDSLWYYYKPPTGVTRLVLDNLPYIRYCIKRIQSIKTKEIKEIIESVPSKHLTSSEAKLIYELLKRRQRDLPKIIAKWIHHVKH